MNLRFQHRSPFHPIRCGISGLTVLVASAVIGHPYGSLLADEPANEPTVPKPGRFAGRVRIVTEKQLPDLAEVNVPPGMVLDESVVFSKAGALANVSVYLRKPAFQFSEPAGNIARKPFLLIADGGRFRPHVAIVRIGRPIVFENQDSESVNCRLSPIRNNPVNVLVASQQRHKVPAFNKVENFPFIVQNDILPGMCAYVFPIDHPFCAVTDEDGRFNIDGLPPGGHEFRVWHERVGYLEKSLIVTIQPGQEVHSDFEYAPSRFELDEAAVVNWGSRQRSARRGPQQLIRRAPVIDPKLSGIVIDAESNKPIPKFTVIIGPRRYESPGTDESDLPIHWQGHLLREHMNGTFDWDPRRLYDAFHVRIDAPGYVPFVSRQFNRADLKPPFEVQLDVKLQPDRGLNGTVLTPAGPPALKAQVALGDVSRELRLQDGKLVASESHKGWTAPIVETDAQGRFRQHADDGPWTMIAVHESSLKMPSVSGSQDWVQEEFRRYSEFNQSEPGKHYRRENVDVAADGSFRIESLPAARYMMHVSVVPKDKPMARAIGFLPHRFEVEPMPGGESREPLQLGELAIRVAPN